MSQLEPKDDSKASRNYTPVISAIIFLIALVIFKSTVHPSTPTGIKLVFIVVLIMIFIVGLVSSLTGYLKRR